MGKSFYVLVSMLALAIALTGYAIAESKPETNTQHLAKELQNPVADLISIPFQNDFQSGLGVSQNGYRYTLKAQPVVPISINNDWNLITRPIFNYISQHDVLGTTSQMGLSDTELELFFSPKEVGSDGIIWGAGPVFLFPTATEAALGTEKWGIGPCAVALKQSGHWTYGALVNQLWSYAGNSNRSDISLFYLQPFAAFSTKKGSTLFAQSESSYDWISQKWTIPLEGGVSQVLPLFGHYFSFGLTGIYNLESPTNISKWSSRLVMTLLLPENK